MNGIDPAAIERTISGKLFLRSTEKEAREVCEKAMALNKTQMSDVETGDDFWFDTPDRTAERLLEYKAIGVHTFIPEIPAPYDEETLERLIGEVKPIVDQG